MKNKKTELRKTIDLYGVTVRDCAKMLGVSQPTMDKYLRNPLLMRLNQLEILANFFQLDLDMMAEIVKGRNTKIIPQKQPFDGNFN